METLGLSDSTPRSDNRLKSLFWPAIQNGTDVDYLGAQGYWVCAVVGVISCAALFMNGLPITGLVFLLFFYLSGVGVRERSRFAAFAVLLMYVLDTVVSRPGVLRVLILTLLLSNLRATWIASSWQPDSEAAILPPRLSETLGDRFADRLPQWLWPKVRAAYYVFAVILLLSVIVGLALGLK